MFNGEFSLKAIRILHLQKDSPRAGDVENGGFGKF